MLKSTFADAIATEMDRILRDNASNAAIEKVATEMPIKRVSDDRPSEIEKELEDSVANATKSLDKTAQHKTSESKDCGPCKGYYVKDKTAGACACDCKSMGDCKNGCACHSSPPKPAMDWAKVKAEVINTLLKASEELDSLGFSKYATLAVVMAAKVSKKTKTTKKDSKKDKEAPKSKSKKTVEKAKSKKSDKAKKDSKKSSK